MAITSASSAEKSLWKQLDLNLRAQFQSIENDVRRWVVQNLRTTVAQGRRPIKVGAQLSRDLTDRLDLTICGHIPARNTLNRFVVDSKHKLVDGGLARLAYALQLAESTRRERVGEQFVPLEPKLAAIGARIEALVEQGRAARKQADLDAGPVAALERIVRAHDHDPHMAKHFLLGRDDAIESYFLVYRHSTVGDHVAKSLLVVRAPLDADRKEWTFENVFRGKPETDRIVRHAEGALVRIGGCYYCLGYTFRVPSDTGLAADEIEARDTRGLVLLAIEASDLDVQPKGPIAALVISIASQGQPIAARAALIHLFSRAASEAAPSDPMLFAPAVLPVRNMAADLIAVVEALVEKTEIRLDGEALALAQVPSIKGRRAAAKAATGRILRYIDNMSEWERMQASSGKRRDVLLNRGALETYAPEGRHRE